MHLRLDKLIQKVIIMQMYSIKVSAYVALIRHINMQVSEIEDEAEVDQSHHIQGHTIRVHRVGCGRRPCSRNLEANFLRLPRNSNMAPERAASTMYCGTQPRKSVSSIQCNMHWSGCSGIGFITQQLGPLIPLKHHVNIVKEKLHFIQYSF